MLRRIPIFPLLFTLLLLVFSTGAQAEFGLHAGSHLGFGNLGGDGQNVTQRTMGVLDVRALPGYRMNGILLGPMLNFRMLSQLSGSGDEEFSGTGSLLGLGAEYEMKPLKFLISYDLMARHSHSGPETVYKGSGFTLLFGYLMMPDVFLDFELNKTTYNMQTVSEADHHLGDRIQHWNFGLGVSISL